MRELLRERERKRERERVFLVKIFFASCYNYPWESVAVSELVCAGIFILIGNEIYRSCSYRFLDNFNLVALSLQFFLIISIPSLFIFVFYFFLFSHSSTENRIKRFEMKEQVK